MLHNTSRLIKPVAIAGNQNSASSGFFLCNMDLLTSHTVGGFVGLQYTQFVNAMDDLTRPLKHKLVFC